MLTGGVRILAQVLCALVIVVGFAVSYEGSAIGTWMFLIGVAAFLAVSYQPKRKRDKPD